MSGQIRSAVRSTEPEVAAYQSLVKFQMFKGHFPFNQKVQFEFKATSSGEWNSIFENFQSEANLARCTQSFGNFFLKVFFPFNFAPGISRIFGWVIRISQIQQYL